MDEHLFLGAERRIMNGSLTLTALVNDVAPSAAWDHALVISLGKTTHLGYDKVVARLAKLRLEHFGVFYSTSLEGTAGFAGKITCQRLRERCTAQLRDVNVIFGYFSSGQMDRLVEQLFDGQQSHTRDPRETIYEHQLWACLPYRPMPYQEALEAICRHKAKVSPALLGKLDKERSEMPQRLYDYFDMYQLIVLQEDARTELELYVFSKSPIAWKNGYGNWANDIEEWYYRQLPDGTRKHKVDLICKLRKLVEKEPARQEDPIEEIDALLVVPQPLQKFTATKTLKAICFNLGIVIQGTMAEVLIDLFCANEKLRQDFVYFTSLEDFRVCPLPNLGKDTLHLIKVFRLFLKMKDWIPAVMADEAAFNTLLEWLYNGKEEQFDIFAMDKPSGSYLTYLCHNTKPAMQAALTIAGTLVLPKKSYLSLFIALLPFLSHESSIKAASVISSILQKKKLAPENHEFWIEVSIVLNPHSAAQIEERALAFDKKFRLHQFASFQTCRTLLLASLSGSISALEKDLRRELPPATLIEAASQPLPPFSDPILVDHSNSCLDLLHALDSRQLSSKDTVYLFLDFLGTRNLSNIRANILLLQWMSKQIYVDNRHVVSWLLYHPKTADAQRALQQNGPLDSQISSETQDLDLQVTSNFRDTAGNMLAQLRRLAMPPAAANQEMCETLYQFLDINAVMEDHEKLKQLEFFAQTEVGLISMQGPVSWIKLVEEWNPQSNKITTAFHLQMRLGGPQEKQESFALFMAKKTLANVSQRLQVEITGTFRDQMVNSFQEDEVFRQKVNAYTSRPDFATCSLQEAHQVKTRNTLVLLQKIAFLKKTLPSWEEIPYGILLQWFHDNIDFNSDFKITDIPPEEICLKFASAIQSTMAIAQKAQITSDSCLVLLKAIFALGKDEQRRMGRTADQVIKASEYFRQKLADDVWVEVCRDLGPYEIVDASVKECMSRFDNLSAETFPNFRNFYNLLTGFFSGTIAAFERSQKCTLSKDALLELSSIQLPWPVRADLIPVSLSQIDRLSRYQFSPKEKAQLFFAFLILNMREVVSANIDQLEWIEKYTNAPLKKEDALNWLLHHPDPKEMSDLFRTCEECRREIFQHLHEKEIPQLTQHRFREALGKFRFCASAKPGHEHEGFLYSLNGLSTQISLATLPISAQPWTQCFSEAAYTGKALKTDDPRERLHAYSIQYTPGSRKAMIWGWQEVHLENPTLNFSIIGPDYRTHTIRMALPFRDHALTSEFFTQIHDLVSFYGEEKAMERAPPVVFDETFLQQVYLFKIAYRTAWLRLAQPEPLSVERLNSKLTSWAKEGSIYPIQGGLSLVPPELLITPEDRKRYAICNDEYGKQIEEILKLVTEGPKEILEIFKLIRAIEKMILESLNPASGLKDINAEIAKLLKERKIELPDVAQQKIQEILQLVKEGQSLELPSEVQKRIKELLELVPTGHTTITVPTEAVDVDSPIFVEYDPFIQVAANEYAVDTALNEVTLTRHDKSYTLRYLDRIDQNWVRWHLLMLRSEEAAIP